MLKSRGFLIFVLANQASNSSHVQSTRQRYNKNEILPHLSVAKRGYICQSRLSEVIPCILYKLKTGCQWYMLPVSSFFAAEKLDLAHLINSYIEYKEEFELNQVLPFNKYIIQEAIKVGYELKKIRWFDEVFENLEMLDGKRL